MGWENRAGRTYYYQKERIGDKVVSRYVGTGEVASLIANMEELERNQREGERDYWHGERERLEAKEQELAAFCQSVEETFRQTLDAAGYHRHHRGAWRKRRGKDCTNEDRERLNRQ